MLTSNINTALRQKHLIGPFSKQYQLTKNLHTIVLSTLTKLCKLDYETYTTLL